MNVLIAEGMSETGVSLLRKKGFGIVKPGARVRKELIDFIVVRSVFSVDGRTLDEFPRLKAVAKLGIGLDNIDLAACRRKGVEVINAPGMNAVSTAEFIVMQVINSFKNTREMYLRVKEKDYRRARYYGRELASLQAGIFGYGNVGKNIAVRIAPFVKRVVIHEKTQTCDLDVDKFLFVPDTKRVLDDCDIVILALPLKGNEEYVDRQFLARLRKDVCLVNAARGGLVDEKVAYEFFRDNREAVYCCDVFRDEPDYTLAPEAQKYSNRLLSLPNVLYSPHIAGMTRESQERIALEIARRIIALSSALRKR